MGLNLNFVDFRFSVVRCDQCLKRFTRIELNIRNVSESQSFESYVRPIFRVESACMVVYARDSYAATIPKSTLLFSRQVSIDFFVCCRASD